MDTNKPVIPYEQTVDEQDLTPQGVGSIRSVAPVRRYTGIRNLMGLLMSISIFFWVTDLYPLGPLNLTALTLGGMLWGLILSFLTLYFLNPSNWQNIPKYFVGKLYLPFGFGGTTQVIAFRRLQRGFKPRLLTPGWNYIRGRIFYQVSSYPWVRVPARGLGYLISNIGKPLEQGQKTGKALPIEVYKDVWQFHQQQGNLGIQRTILTPGFFNPIDPVGFIVITDDENGIYGEIADSDLKAKQEQGKLKWQDYPGFTPEHFKPFTVPDGKQGIVTILDGEPLPSGEIVHRFGGWKDIKDFLEKNKEVIKEESAKKGQLEQQEREKKTDTDKLEMLKKCEAKPVDISGLSEQEWTDLLGQNYEATEDIFKTGRRFEMRLCQKLLRLVLKGQLSLHDSYQDLQKYFGEEKDKDKKTTKEPGRMGPQWDTLPPSVYNLNRFVVQVESVELLIVEPGFVKVIKADVGLTSEDITHRRFRFGAIVRPGSIGTWLAPPTPGAYLINTKYLHPTNVPTAMVTLFWGDGTKALTLEPGGKALDAELSPIITITKDGFKDIKLDIDVQVIFPAESAAIIIASFGSIEDLVDGFIAAKLSAFTIGVVRNHIIEQLIENQLKVQDKIKQQMVGEFTNFEIEVRAVLIQKIDGAQSYLEIREAIVLAGKNELLRAAEAKVEAARKETQKNKGEADQAYELAVAEQGIQIATNINTAVEALLNKIDQYRKNMGDKSADELASGLAQGLTLYYQRGAVGEAGATLLKVIDKIAEAGIDIVSKVSVGGEQVSLIDAIIGGYLGQESTIKALSEWSKKTKKTTTTPAPTPT